MKGWLVALAILVGLALVVVGYLWLSFYDIHVRYRLTIEVQDGDQIRTGSSVIDASYTIQPDYIWAGPNTHVEIDGYAPTVDLGEKGMLFLTFASMDLTPDQMWLFNKQLICAKDDMWCLPFSAYYEPGTFIGPNTYSGWNAALYALLRHSGPRDVPFICLPLLARTLDVGGEHKLMPVSPGDLGASFGAGVQLKRVILQLTDEPVTPQPQIWPQWLKQSGGTYVGILSGVSK
jgi:hypothetical protein